jgi:hypothetical protein
VTPLDSLLGSPSNGATERTLRVAGVTVPLDSMACPVTLLDHTLPVIIYATFRSGVFDSCYMIDMPIAAAWTRARRVVCLA